MSPTAMFAKGVFDSKLFQRSYEPGSFIASVYFTIFILFPHNEIINRKSAG